jgi:hypothetical protein
MDGCFNISNIQLEYMSNRVGIQNPIRTHGLQMRYRTRPEKEKGGLAIDDPEKSSFHLGLHAKVQRGCLACSDLQLSVYRRIVDSLFIRICVLYVYIYIYIHIYI